jgi:hypothetical protein
LGRACGAIAWLVKRYIATLDMRFGRIKLSEFTRGLVRSDQRRWLGDFRLAPSSEVNSIEHDTKQVRRNECKLRCS